MKRTGDVVQVVNYLLTTIVSGTVAIPYDNTIPQKTEGNESFTLAITPTSVVNKLRIDVVVGAMAVTSRAVSVALFQDDTADALAATASISHAYAHGNWQAINTLTHIMAAGTVSATTFKIRTGASDTSGCTVNGSSIGGQLFNGVFATTMVITEYFA